MIHSFSPTKAKEPEVLVLGSIPSITSLEKQEYYGFSHNRFWKIVARHFNTEFHNYAEKLNCLEKNKIMLWDVIALCEREGSLDANIRDVTCNDIEKLIKEYPSINEIFCNGKKSYALYKKHFSHLEIAVVSLPSTSNANRSISEESLFQEWMDAFSIHLT